MNRMEYVLCIANSRIITLIQLLMYDNVRHYVLKGYMGIQFQGDAYHNVYLVILPSMILIYALLHVLMVLQTTKQGFVFLTVLALLLLIVSPINALEFVQELNMVKEEFALALALKAYMAIRSQDNAKETVQISIILLHKITLIYV